MVSVPTMHKYTARQWQICLASSRCRYHPISPWDGLQLLCTPLKGSTRPSPAVGDLSAVDGDGLSLSRSLVASLRRLMQPAWPPCAGRGREGRLFRR
eukprot:4490623-Pleurochrysis_carterae.AAC.1